MKTSSAVGENNIEWDPVSNPTAMVGLNPVNMQKVGVDWDIRLVEAEE